MEESRLPTIGNFVAAEDVEEIRLMLRTAPKQLRVFDLLQDREWHCRDCEGANLRIGQYAGGGGIQGLKRGSRTRVGLKIHSRRTLCQTCGKKTQMDRWTGETAVATTAAHIPPALALRILNLYNYRDAIENRYREQHELIIDHRFPMLRWGGQETNNDPNMDDDEIRRKFQLLKKDSYGNHNQLKSRACESCLRNGLRGTPLDIQFWYEGDRQWGLQPQTGREAEAGCIGCGWYNFERWRIALNRKLNESE